MNNSNKRVVRTTFILLIFPFLGSCSSEPDQALQTFVRRVRTQKTEELTPLPEFKNNAPFFYQATALRNPFEGYGDSIASQLSHEERDSETRPREPLEHYPIESLKMVGYLEKNQVFWGLVKDKQGIVHKVSMNQHIGQNNGKIVKIYPNGIEIEEKGTADEKRQITLPLSHS